MKKLERYTKKWCFFALLLLAQFIFPPIVQFLQSIYSLAWNRPYSIVLNFALLPGDFLPWGDKRMWVCGRLVRPQSPIPLFLLYVPSWTPRRPGGHSLNPAALGWPALLDCRMRMTASSIGPKSTAAGTGHHRPTWLYWFESFVLEAELTFLYVLSLKKLSPTRVLESWILNNISAPSWVWI